MARPQKTGLDYFPVDTDIFQDEKIQHVSAIFGLKAEAIAFRLLCKIYRNGAYLLWNEDAENLFSQSLGRKISKKSIHEIIEEFIKRNFFDRKMFDQHGILTSNGIQQRYIGVCKHLNRKSTLPEYFLISSREMNASNSVSSRETPSPPIVSSQKSTQKKRKEIKEKEIKIKENDFSNNENIEYGTDEYFEDQGRKLYRAAYGDK